MASEVFSGKMARVYGTGSVVPCSNGKHFHIAVFDNPGGDFGQTGLSTVPEIASDFPTISGNVRGIGVK